MAVQSLLKIIRTKPGYNGVRYSRILQGYNELLPLYEDEIKAMPMLFVFNEMLLTAFYLKIGELEIAKSCLEMANWLYENIAILIY